MPEMPEVETVRRGLMNIAAGRKIQGIDVYYGKTVENDIEEFRQALIGQTIERIDRRGKYLLFRFTNNLTMVSHLRMEGKYFFYPDEVPLRKHAHVFFHFTDGSTLVYEDVRKFGTMEVIIPELVDSYFLAKKIGPEPTEADFKEPAFQAALKQSKKPIKSALLDQKLVAGLGNIYVDEVLYRAKVHPARLGQSLTAREATAIRKETIAVLAQAVEKGGSTIRSYSNAFGEDGTMQEEHQVYGKTGQPCLRCGTPIEKIQLGGRGTHFCPHCQKEN